MILIIRDAAGVVYPVIKYVMAYLTVPMERMNVTAVSADVLTVANCNL